MTSMRIDGVRVLLTGATGGIGTVLAGQLADRGGRLVLVGRNPDALDGLAGSLRGEHEALVADLADPAATAELARRAEPVEVLICNAGLEAADRLEDLTADEAAADISVNLTSAAVLAATVGAGMCARGGGHVVLMSSIAGLAATVANGPLYTATKWGLRGLGLQLRQDWRDNGIGVSVVYPGPVGEVGMAARTGAKLPPGIRTVSAYRVARAIIRAIEHNRAEVIVADVVSRSLCAISTVAPRLVASAVRQSPHAMAARAAQVRAR